MYRFRIKRNIWNLLFCFYLTSMYSLEYKNKTFTSDLSYPGNPIPFSGFQLHVATAKEIQITPMYQPILTCLPKRRGTHHDKMDRDKRCLTLQSIEQCGCFLATGYPYLICLPHVNTYRKLSGTHNRLPRYYASDTQHAPSCNSFQLI